MPRPKKTSSSQPPLPGAPVTIKKQKASKLADFDRRLVLQAWFLNLFGAQDLVQWAKPLTDDRLEGFREDGFTHYIGVCLQPNMHPSTSPLSEDQLRQYDTNITRHWKALAETRRRFGQAADNPKYFQYLALLFTEIYLDRYFSNSAALLSELNTFLETFNAELDEASRLPPYLIEDLNKLAFWQATGSGKTLLMHVNLRQYQHYLQKHGQRAGLNRIILLTPNEGLSRQHLDEFRYSGIEAESFNKDGRGLFVGQAVEVIEITKLVSDDEANTKVGEKRVMVEAFEGNNLVLVDEGHRGTSSDEQTWKKRRDRLCAQGFSFEYSATFKQAVGKKPALSQEYAKCIVLNYSYKYFFNDGYGKLYQILNLSEDWQDESRELYLVAAVLAYYQQLRLYIASGAQFKPYLIQRPLWVFVGARVTKGLSTQEASDIVEILRFLKRFVGQRSATINRIWRLLANDSGLLDNSGHNVFANAFPYLRSLASSAEQLYAELLRDVFNAPAPAALHVDYLRGGEGELALRLGDNPDFGVINVGDAKKLHGLCLEDGLPGLERDFSISLFDSLNTSDKLNLLIGAKKFTEGWNSYRVSSMGLMNVGQSEGSEIIQLFGRGVRLKGYQNKLKRSRVVSGVLHPQQLERLETLHIFGIRATYMEEFRKYLEEEGLPPGDNWVEFVLPVVKNLGQVKLKTLKLPDDLDYKQTGPKPLLEKLDEISRRPVVLDWYPRIQALHAKGLAISTNTLVKNETKLAVHHLALINWDEVYFELTRYKHERAWYNLNLPRTTLRSLFERDDWYVLKIPAEELVYDRYDRVRHWQEIVIALLQKYADRYYNHRRAEYETPYLAYQDLAPDDPNFIDEWRIRVEQSQTTLIADLTTLAEDFQNKRYREFAFNDPRFQTVIFDRHLYFPLLHAKSDSIEVRPVSLNEGELKFVLDLRTFCQTNKSFFSDKELYLLRNQSRSRGLGFFEANNFYPDFLLWILYNGRQYIAFTDPKGIHNLEGPDDDKIKFHRTVKTIEARLAASAPEITLNSFIISVTAYTQVKWWALGMTMAQFEAQHVLFQIDDETGYIRKLLDKTLAIQQVAVTP